MSNLNIINNQKNEDQAEGYYLKLIQNNENVISPYTKTLIHNKSNPIYSLNYSNQSLYQGKMTLSNKIRDNRICTCNSVRCQTFNKNYSNFEKIDRKNLILSQNPSLIQHSYSNYPIPVCNCYLNLKPNYIIRSNRFKMNYPTYQPIIKSQNNRYFSYDSKLENNMKKK